MLVFLPSLTRELHIATILLGDSLHHVLSGKNHLRKLVVHYQLVEGSSPHRVYLSFSCLQYGALTSEVKCHAQRPILKWYILTSVVPYIDLYSLKGFALKGKVVYVFISLYHGLPNLVIHRDDAELKSHGITNHTGFH